MDSRDISRTSGIVLFACGALVVIYDTYCCVCGRLCCGVHIVDLLHTCHATACHLEGDRGGRERERAESGGYIYIDVDVRACVCLVPSDHHHRGFILPVVVIRVVGRGQGG